jgi:hypothetical protein
LTTLIECIVGGKDKRAMLRILFFSWGVVQFHRFNATEMLDLIRGKRLVFVGDSIYRNRWESVLCMLMGAVKDPKKVYETHGRKITMEKGNYSFKFVVRSDLAILTSYFVGFVAVF